MTRPSELALKIAVAMEAHAALRTTTIAKAETIDGFLTSDPLRAAAPEMYEAAMKARGALPDDSPEAKALDAAMAKARGET